MKDRGVEWIGDIPTEWKLIPFRHVLKERQKKQSHKIRREFIFVL